CEMLAQYRDVVHEIAKRGVGGLLAKDRFGLPTLSISAWPLSLPLPPKSRCTMGSTGAKY
ncbi:hypothetical protein, partial [Ferrimicrobium sp.]|uniref:hypothetical protein n=1 Tax=Ferrimicrobium sp. TaxID=2926050 RepID=UPI00260F0088